jgi:hypothetical protein
MAAGTEGEVKESGGATGGMGWARINEGMYGSGLRNSVHVACDKSDPDIRSMPATGSSAEPHTTLR